MRKKELSRIQYIIVWLLTIQVFSVYGEGMLSTDSTACASAAIGSDCACKFTEIKDLGHFLNSMSDNCVLLIVDTLIDNSSSIQCRRALDRIIAVSDGYLSDYLGTKLASTLLESPDLIFSWVYKGNQVKVTRRYSLLIVGLSMLYVDNPNILKNIDYCHLKRKARRKLKSIEQDIVEFIRLNPGL